MAEVYVSSVIGARTDLIWSLVRDFNAISQWVPPVVECRIEGGSPADQVGCVRNFRLSDGGRLREKLLALSDFDYSYTYAMLESPMAVENYVATLKLTPVTDGNRTFVEWSADFECNADREAELVADIGGSVFQASFDALKTRFGS